MAFDIAREIREGLILGIGFILLNLAFGVSIGFPLLSFNTLFEKYAVVSVLAPLGEELLFGSLLLVVIYAVTKNKLLTRVLSGVIFTVFHFVAYGASFEAANASFIGAFIFRLLADTIILNQHSNLESLPIPISSIIGHAIINTYLVIKVTGLVIVGV